MKKHIKHFLTILLTCSLILNTVFSVYVRADDPEGEPTESGTVTEGYDPLDDEDTDSDLLTDTETLESEALADPGTAAEGDETNDSGWTEDPASWGSYEGIPGLYEYTSPDRYAFSEDLILAEEEELRGESEKHFLLEGGAYVAAGYGHAVHELNTDGSWVEIDNTLEHITDTLTGESVYIKTGLYDQITFPGSMGNGERIIIERDEGSIEWGLYDSGIGSIMGGGDPEDRGNPEGGEDTPETEEESADAGEDPETEEESVDAGEDGSTEDRAPSGEPGRSGNNPEWTVYYDSLEPEDTVQSAGTSISGVLSYTNEDEDYGMDYLLVGHDIKENLILYDSGALSLNLGRFFYVLKTTGDYYAVQTDSKTISILDGDDETVYEFTAPWACDADNAYTADVTLTFDSLQPDGSHIVKLEVDEDWLFSTDRVFPVTIDPTVTYRQSGAAAMDNVTVYSASPTSNMYRYGELYVGTDWWSGKTRSIVKLNNLPKISEADTVINAVLGLQVKYYSEYWGQDPAVSVINVHEMTSDTPLNQLNWNNISGKYAGTVLDSVLVDSNTFSTSYPMLCFDITKAVKKWYQDGNNYGLAFDTEHENEERKRVIWLYSATGADRNVNTLPVFYVTYLNREGLEDYLTYHSTGSETMGTLSVSDSTGHLVYAYTDLSMTGAYLPVTLGHVYNHSRRGQADIVNSSMHFGNGMRLNLSLRIRKSNVEGYPYRFTDADGTEHYFKLKSGTLYAAGSKYEKEFESTTVIEKLSDGFLLTDGGTVTYKFNTNGYLTRITDTTTGKYQALGYSNARLTSVTDGANRTVTLSYNSAGYLTAVTDPAGRSTTYTYDSSHNLVRITREDGLYVNLSYENQNGKPCLTKVRDIDGTSVGITYYSEKLKRVRYLTEYGSNDAEGRKLTFTYKTGETTVKDRDNRSETMVFDMSGHTVSVRNNAGQACFGSYSSGNRNSRHSLLYSSLLRGSVTNYVRNHDFEKGTASPWSLFNGNNNGSLALDTDHVREGNKSLRLTVTNANVNCGPGQTADLLTAAAGKTVTLSAYILFTDYSPTASKGLRFNIRYKNASGAWVSKYSPVIQKAGGWNRYSWTVNIPSDAVGTSVQPVIAFTKCAGTCCIDSVQLETGAVSNSYNLLENGHFFNAQDTVTPSYWSRFNLISTDKTVSGRNGNGYRITGERGKNKGLSQTVFIKNGKKGDSYVFGAWAKADAIPYQDLTFDGKRDFAVRLRFYNSSNTYKDVTVQFEGSAADWQYLSGSATAPFNYTKVCLTLLYSHQKNSAVFDDVYLFREGFGDILSYDSYGRVEKRTDASGLSAEYTYLNPGQPEISRIRYSDGTEYNYTYDSSRKLLTITDTSGKTVNFNYDSNGNAIGNSMSVGGTTLKSAALSYTGSYVSSSTDPFGNSTSYSYNQSKGTLINETDGRGNTTGYTYNADNDYLTGMTSGNSAISMNYTSGRLSSVSRKTDSNTSDNVTYSFQYNTYGTETGVKVGNRSLVSYSYASYNGDLTGTAFGNGDTVTPSYDSLGRITAVSYNGTPAYRFYYDNGGKTGYERDLTSGTDTRCLYDSAGRLKEKSSSKGERHVYNYDGTTGDVTSSTYYSAGTGTAVKTSYTYGKYNNNGERLLNKITAYNNRYTLTYSYDSFYRKSSTLQMIDGGSVAVSYGFRTGNTSNSTSLMPASRTETVKNPSGQTVGSSVLKYSYDGNGNVTEVRDGNNTVKLRYQYDSLDELIREDNTYLDRTYIYSYDFGGNLLSKTEYAYTAANTVSGTPISTKTYLYGDSNWKDKLTSYNGNSISYDEIGNPLSYCNGFTFTWQRGRQLASASRGAAGGNPAVSVSYSYNYAGIRTSKTVNNTRTDYTLEGDRVVFETDGTTNLRYFYDETGSPYAFMIGGKKFAYLKNLSGDILGVVNWEGVQLVRYSYDAWGKPYAENLIASGDYLSVAEDVIEKNPYLYRGYRYDRETGLYYLNSRYYDPETGRFINADTPETITSDFENFVQYNLFAYCFNNPVKLSDEIGTWPSWATKLAIGVGAIVVGAAVVAATAATGGAAAAFVGAAAAGLKAAVVSGAIGAAVGAGTSAVSHHNSTGSWTGAGKAAIDGAVDGFSSGFMTGGIMAGGSQILSSGFKVAANAGVPTGRNGGLTVGENVRMLSPNHPQGYEAGGTLLKIGSKYENIRFDVGSKSLFHMNVQLSKAVNYHIPIGALGSGLLGGFIRD